MKTAATILRTGHRSRPSTGERFFLLLLLGLLLAFTGWGQSFPTGFNQVAVSSGISNPTALTFAPDGRIFVAEQGGKLRVIKNGGLLPMPFVQLSVNSSGERGLIGVELDPNFAVNQYVYLYYTVSTAPLHNRISRFTAVGDVAVAGSETVVLDLDPLSSATNHNGGAMHFGLDGKLYVAVGENATPSNAQNLDTYHGKILRLNPDGSVPAGNPFASGSEQKKRVWSYGLRNPYTFAVQPGTGRIFVNDVGQNTWEEINDASTSGVNFGWPATEGATTAAGVTGPVFAYPHGSGDGKGCAITGGTFFNPATTTYPAQLQGKYFYQDLCNQWINYIDLSGGAAVRSAFATGLPGNALALTTGPDGNLYYLSRSAGTLYKVVYSVAAAPAITGQPANVSVAPGQTASFTVSASGTGPLGYQWQKNGVNIGGATAATYIIASVVAADSGQYRAVVSNAAGSATSAAARLRVTAPNLAPTAQILTPADSVTYVAGTTLAFSGAATDAEDGALPASAFSWRVDFHHDQHVHDGTPFNQGAKTGTFAIPNTGETAANVWYRLYLTVTDSRGLSTTVQRDIYPRTSTFTLATSPAGLRLTLDGQPVTAPVAVLGVQGVLRTLGVVSPQTVNGVTYEFTGWSQGGSATQTLPTPAANTTFTASFRVVPTLRAADMPAATVAGLQYAYYEGSWNALPTFSSLTPVKSGTVAEVTLAPRNRNDNFALRYSGYVRVPTDGQYTFYLNSDDGSQLLIGSTLVVNNDGLHAAREQSGTIGLKAGLHALTITFFEKTGQQVLVASYAGPGLSKQVLPAASLARAADAPTGPVAAGVYQLVVRHSGKALDVPGGTSAEGALLQQYTINTSSGQAWNLQFVANNTYTLVSQASGKALTVPGSTTTAGTQLQQQTLMSGALNQQWRLEAASDGYFLLLNVATGQAIDVNGVSTADGAAVIQWTRHGNPNQQWLLQPSSVTAGGRLTAAPAAAQTAARELTVYPNPARGSRVTLSVEASAARQVRLEVLDGLGRRVGTVLDWNLSPGHNETELPTAALPAGLYTIRLLAEGMLLSRRLVVE
ncbi:T9SS C-terminal target domain-containing protein [Hymenobacter lapidiphilus]|uniref:PQQ-dependent sugar dehydrogenase n=1 Tax=Hymenobacter sp. CCM 8763 TaxID=2303334 RepID=UPI000E34FF11|nr:PQQ-dependent sugar dehydrogenase [Hymenobacter sp. CCM 8763]RFP66829.1 T9SS C-terminal target domain-containing protein [Hymenobacter sp. CCM 8763]